MAAEKYFPRFKSQIAMIPNIQTFGDFRNPGVGEICRGTIENLFIPSSEIGKVSEIQLLAPGMRDDPGVTCHVRDRIIAADIVIVGKLTIKHANKSMMLGFKALDRIFDRIRDKPARIVSTSGQCATLVL